jgi:hypothetical protein
LETKDVLKTTVTHQDSTSSKMVAVPTVVLDRFHVIQLNSGWDVTLQLLFLSQLSPTHAQLARVKFTIPKLANAHAQPATNVISMDTANFQSPNQLSSNQLFNLATTATKLLTTSPILASNAQMELPTTVTPTTATSQEAATLSLTNIKDHHITSSAATDALNAHQVKYQTNSEPDAQPQSLFNQSSSNLLASDVYNS